MSDVSGEVVTAPRTRGRKEKVPVTGSEQTREVVLFRRVVLGGGVSNDPCFSTQKSLPHPGPRHGDERTRSLSPQTP